jgi:hypothetical protein
VFKPLLAALWLFSVRPDIACGQIDIGNALTEIARKQSQWVRLRLRGPIKSTLNVVSALTR